MITHKKRWVFILSKFYFTVYRTNLKTFCSNVRVRFAPSPTGNLHLGGLRTALYNYMFARKNNGQFILRIEDTDQKRIIEGSLENIQNMLKWVGIHADEDPAVGGPYGPYIQSQRIAKYKEKAEELMQYGFAYRCFCSETRLQLIRKEAMKNRENPKYDNRCRHLTANEVEDYVKSGQPYTIRFKLQSGPIMFDDIVFGNHTLDVSEFSGDFIILKSDGFPTYHFSCVIDDHLMNISHVLRGAEWLSSTTKHIMLHNAFGWNPPAFAHLPLLINSDRTKLSKRQEALGIEYFKKQGYEPLALVNFLCGIGSGFGLHATCDIFDLPDLWNKFNLSEVSTNSCILDAAKIDVYNRKYLTRQLSNKISTDELIKSFKTLMIHKLGMRFETEIANLSDQFIKKVLYLYKDRISSLQELVDPEMQYLWTIPDQTNIKTTLEELQIPIPTAVESSQKVFMCLQDVPESEYQKEPLTLILRKCSSGEKLPYVKFMRMLRIVLTGLKDGPGVAEILTILGSIESLKKLEAFIKDHSQTRAKTTE